MFDKVQRLGAQAITGAFRSVAGSVLQDEAGLEPTRMRLARRVANHVVTARALPKDNPLRTVIDSMHKRGAGHQSPIFAYGQNTIH